MKIVGTHEAKTHFSELLEQVNAGESFIITRHGVPAAQLCPMAPQPNLTVAEAIQEIRQFREKHSLGGLAIRDLIDEGRP